MPAHWIQQHSKHALEHIAVSRTEHSMVISVDRVDSFDEHSAPLHDSSSEGARNKRITRPHNGERAFFPKSVTRRGSVTILLYSAWNLNQSNNARERGAEGRRWEEISSTYLLVFLWSCTPKTLIIPPNFFDQHCKKSFLKNQHTKLNIRTRKIIPVKTAPSSPTPTTRDVKEFFWCYFWDYIFITAFFVVFAPSKPSHIFLPALLQIHGLFLKSVVIACIYVCIYIHL